MAEPGRTWHFVTSHGVVLINETQPMRHPAIAAHPIGELLAALAPPQQASR